MSIVKSEVTIGGKVLSLEIGRFAKLANAAVVARYGDTMILATVVSSKEKSNLSYFPLMVEYAERLYAGGKIKGSRWVKREGRPSDDAILSARLIDRAIRPLFPKDYKHDVQVIVTILSVDGENDPDIMSLIAVSAALTISDIPWNGPIGAVRVGMVNGENTKGKPFIVNPAVSELTFSKMDLVVAATPKKVMMLEGGFQQVNEEDTLSAIEFAKEECGKIIKTIKDLAGKINNKKQEYEKSEIDADFVNKLKKQYAKEIENLIIQKTAKEYDDESLGLLVEAIAEKEEETSKDTIAQALDYLFKEDIRHNLINGKRPDKRELTQIRPLKAEISILPRTHGSALFERGQTQALSIVTLASPSLEQLIESAQGEETKRYIHHYNMPPYSVGETGRTGWPSRREVGHGALAERALLPVIPSEEKFPYTIRVVSEVMTSNGSTSMASVCGSTLALMDAGVPIIAPVAGISIGLATKDEKYILLTDIAGIEDFCGDMDFKVAGTKNGITAIQLDVKTDGLTDEIISETLKRAREARLFILEKMLSVIPTHRGQISQYAPKVMVLKVPSDKIGAVIGPGGKIIRKIISDTGVTVDVNDEDESVTISGLDIRMVEKAKGWIEGIIREIQVGEVFEGEVKRILNFGAFVEMLPGKEGLVHVSRMSTNFVKDPNDIVKIGDKVKVRVVEIDEMGRTNLSMLFGEDSERKDRPQPFLKNPPFKRPRR